MSERVSGLLEELGTTLRALPDVFSTTQWGGRAYKLPGPGGSRRKPKLLAFVAATKDGDAVSVSFKLEKDRAETMVAKYAWIEPHSFGTLRGSGWLSARVTQKRQTGVLRRLLGESRTLHPVAPAGDEPADAPDRGRAAGGARSGRASSPEAARLDRVMQEARESGWSPPPEIDDDFDRAPAARRRRGQSAGR